MKPFFRILGAFSIGIFGGWISTFLPQPILSNDATRAHETTLQSMRLVDGHGRQYARFMPSHPGGSDLSFLDEQGNIRLKMGLRGNGLPYIGLFSGTNSEHPKMLLELVGPNESAQLVLRDKWNKERLVMGLDSAAKSEDPFFVYYDRAGTVHPVFGRR